MFKKRLKETFQLVTVVLISVFIFIVFTPLINIVPENVLKLIAISLLILLAVPAICIYINWQFIEPIKYDKKCREHDENK